MYITEYLCNSISSRFDGPMSRDKRPILTQKYRYPVQKTTSHDNAKFSTFKDFGKAIIPPYSVM